MRSATKLRIGKDPAYLAFIADQPCCVCEVMENTLLRNNLPAMGIQTSRTEAAHVGEIRGLSQKCPDRETLPLCGVEHHREGRFSAHRLQKDFWAYHGLDRDELIAKYNAAFERRTEAA